MDPSKPHTSPKPTNAKEGLPVGKHTASNASANSETIHKILRLFPSSFCFPRNPPLFHPSHRQSIHTALGAVNRQGRAGKQSTVLKRVILTFRLAIQTHLFYPSYDLEAKTFWTTVLADVRDEEPLIGQELNAAALADIVGVYTQAYANAHSEEDEEEKDNNDGFDAAFELLTPKKRNIDPRKKLVSLVRAWAKLFRIHKAKKASKCSIAAATASNEPSHETMNNDTSSTSAIPDQLPNESDASYITRLQSTIKSTIAAEKAAQKTITELQRSQALADEHHRSHNDRLHATIDRMDGKIKDLERELRLERIGAGGGGGGGEDDPWVPWREYAGQLDGAL